MNTSILTVPSRRSVQWIARWADYLELTKPKIAILELVTVAVAAWVAGLEVWPLVHVLLGTALVAASASALNQWWEIRLDRMMPRTRHRPLPDERIAPGDVLRWAILGGVVGVAYLSFAVNMLTAAIGLLSWVLYVLIYTPMKVRTPANTMVGAVSGALPILMGWTAMGRPLDLQAATLFLIVFLWQFPHFMAIAWIYRQQYGAVGMKMLPVVDPTGLRAAAQAVLAALALIPVSLIPALFPFSGSVYIYFAAALILGVGQLICAVVFLVRLDDDAARRLLRASLVYLPALLVCLLVASGA